MSSRSIKTTSTEVGDAEFQQLRVTVGDLDDIEPLVLAEKGGQPETEEPFRCDHDDGDTGIGDRGIIRRSISFDGLG